MNMLDRAAKAMERQMYAMEKRGGENGPDCYRRLGMSEYKELARAVLMAVRDPSDDVVSVGFDAAFVDDTEGIKQAFIAMIDDILSGASNPPSEAADDQAARAHAAFSKLQEFTVEDDDLHLVKQRVEAVLEALMPPKPAGRD